MDLQLRGKTAIITGASRGIGKAIARQLAAEGVDLALAARSLAPLQTTADEIAAESGRRVHAIACDTGDTEAVRAMVKEAAGRLGGRIDILVNSAARPSGQAPEPSLAEFTDEYFWGDMNIKVMGYLRCAREVAPYMQKQGWGRIINISGLGARRTGSMIGSMRNVAVAAMTKNLADELGPSGINVTVVHPGLTRTEATPQVLQWRAGKTGKSVAEVEADMARMNSVRRFLDAADVANVVTFLASPLSVAINGDAIAAGGGAPGTIHY